MRPTLRRPLTIRRGTFPSTPSPPSSLPTTLCTRPCATASACSNSTSRNAGTPAWNPLGGIVRPGTRVLIKPNLVRHYHDKLGDVDCLLTHGSVVRAICDYVVIAMEGRGQLTIADTPIDMADFDAICRLTGLAAVADFIRKETTIDVRLLDLRTERLVKDDLLTIRESISLPGDPEGYATVDFGAASALRALDGPDTNYYTLGDETVNHLDPGERKRGQPNAYHHPGSHKYKIGNSVAAGRHRDFRRKAQDAQEGWRHPEHEEHDRDYLRQGIHPPPSAGISAGRRRCLSPPTADRLRAKAPLQETNRELLVLLSGALQASALRNHGADPPDRVAKRIRRLGRVGRQRHDLAHDDRHQPGAALRGPRRRTAA